MTGINSNLLSIVDVINLLESTNYSVSVQYSETSNTKGVNADMIIPVNTISGGEIIELKTMFVYIDNETESIVAFIENN